MDKIQDLITIVTKKIRHEIREPIISLRIILFFTKTRMQNFFLMFLTFKVIQWKTYNKWT